mmetsp:Transcript_18419/g.29462  ORF Transcript_18419/g.29462 Transcript_18419/m.29462 type:complete len:141 (+) Transcript_18419:89-511(+)
MTTGLTRLDIAMEATASLRTPPTSPVRSYYDVPMTPPSSNRGFVDWEPGMDTELPDFPILALDPEAELLASPLGRRFQSPKGGLLVVAEAGDNGPEPNSDEKYSNEPQETDMRVLMEEYEQILQARADTADDAEEAAEES